MKKINTVKAHRDFDRIIRHGHAIKSPNFSVYSVPSDLGFARIGISVGKKNGIAVRRVLIKRQVRAIIAKADLLALSVDVIVTIRPTYEPKNYTNLEEELLLLLSQLKETIH